MTPTRHLTRLVLLQVAFLLLGVCHDVGCVAHAGQYRHFRKTVIQPQRIRARAANGFPLRQAIAYGAKAIYHGAKAADHVTAPLGWFGPGGLIRGLIIR
jgi:hypothetical protein